MAQERKQEKQERPDKAEKPEAEGNAAEPKHKQRQG